MAPITLPSGRTVEVRAFKTREQKDQFRKLHDKKTAPSAVTGFMELCVTHIDGEPVSKEMASDRRSFKAELLDLLAEDRKAVLLAIRRATLGDDFAFTFTCPKCKHETPGLEVSLTEVEQRPYPNGTEKLVEVTIEVGTEDAPEKRTFLVSLLDGNAEERAAKIPASTVDNLTPLDLRLPRERGRDKEDPEKWVPIVPADDLTPKEVAALTSACRKAEGLVDLVINVTCGQCSQPGKINVVTEMGFFWPGMQS